jgi:MATE family multidrug resistance protein
MLVVVTTNLTNIALDFLFIMGMGMNSDGAALATVIAEYLGCGVALWAVFRQVSLATIAFKLSDLAVVSAYKSLLSSNRHLFVRTMCLLFGFAFFTAQGENFGSETLAANALMIQLVMLAAYGMDGFAFAAEGLSGHRLGGRNLSGFYIVVKRCSWWTMVSAGVMSLFFLVFEQALISVLTSIGSVKELMANFFPWLVMLPLLAAPSYLLDGVFIGAAATRYMMTTMLQSLLLVYLPLWYVTLDLGNHGLWLSFSAFNLARGVFLYYWYRRISREGGWLSANAA